MIVALPDGTYYDTELGKLVAAPGEEDALAPATLEEPEPVAPPPVPEPVAVAEPEPIAPQEPVAQPQIPASYVPLPDGSYYDRESGQAVQAADIPQVMKTYTGETRSPFAASDPTTTEAAKSTSLMDVVSDVGEGLSNAGASFIAGTGKLISEVGGFARDYVPLPGAELPQVRQIGEEAALEEYTKKMRAAGTPLSVDQQFAIRDQMNPFHRAGDPITAYGEAMYSDEFAADLQKEGINAAKIINGVAGSLPASGGSMWLGALATRGLMAANMAGRFALLSKIQPGYVVGATEEAIAAAEAAAVQLNRVDSWLGAAGFGLGEGLVSGVLTGESLKDRTLATPFDNLMAVPRFVEILKSTDDSLSDEDRKQYARQTLANEAGMSGGIKASIVTGLLGQPSNAFFGRVIGKTGLMPTAEMLKGFGISTTRLGVAGQGALLEGIQEVGQSAAEQVVTNMAAQEFINPTEKLTGGVFEAAIIGGLAGGITGGVFGFLAGPKPGDQQKEFQTVGEKVAKLYGGALEERRTLLMDQAQQATDPAEKLRFMDAHDALKEREDFIAERYVDESAVGGADPGVYEMRFRRDLEALITTGQLVDEQAFLEAKNRDQEYTGFTGDLDALEIPSRVPQHHEHYFAGAGGEVSVRSLLLNEVPTQTKIENEAKKLRLIRDGQAELRAPIRVRAEQGGMFTVLDEVAAVEAMKQRDWKTVPIQIVEVAEGVDTQRLDPALFTAPEAAGGAAAKPKGKGRKAKAEPEIVAGAQAGEAGVAKTPEGEALTTPKEKTPGQIIAGNYKKEHVTHQGLSISIETKKGETRVGKGWKQLMKHAYGYIRGTVGEDGGQVDVFLGPQPDNALRPAHVIHQLNDQGEFDEHKVMLGFASKAEAKKAYLANYPEGQAAKIGQIETVPSNELKGWLKALPSREKYTAREQPVQPAPEVVEKPAPKVEQRDTMDLGGLKFSLQSGDQWQLLKHKVKVKGKEVTAEKALELHGKRVSMLNTLRSCLQS